MSLQDRFRIDELTKVGSKSITRDESGRITVRKINNKEVKPDTLSNNLKPFGEQPIKGKQVNPRTKEDLASLAVLPNPNQESFSGETSTHIEVPRYNEEELKKAVDVKVDELIKEKKPPRGEFVPKKKLDDLKNQYKDVTDKLKDVRRQLSDQTSRASRFESQSQSLLSEVESLNGQIQELNIQIGRNTETISNQLGDIQVKTTDIFTLQAEVAKWQAEAASIRQQLESQTRNLEAQLATQDGIIDSLNNQNQTLQDQIKVQAEIFAGQLNQAAVTLETTQENFQTQLAAQQQALELAQTQFQAQLEAVQRQRDRAQKESDDKGKKIICNELYRQGYLPQLLWDADERYGDMMFEKDPRLVIGYQMWARYVVKFMRENKQYSKFAYWLFKPWTEFMGYEMGIIKKQNWRGKFTNFVGKYVSYLVFDLNNGQRLLDLYNYKKFQESIG